MKKRIFSLLLSIVIISSLFPSSVIAAENTCGDNATWEITENGELIISGTGVTDSYSSSSKVPWSSQKHLIKKVTVSEGITKIGDKNFIGLSNLKTVSLPDTLTAISTYVFYECVGLNDIIIPKSVTTIGANAFAGCTNLKNVYFKGSSIEWSNIAIGGSNTELTNATLHCSLTEYPATCGPNAKWVLYDSGILMISGTGSIQDCSSSSAQPWASNRSSIKNIIIENGITSVGSKVFYNSESLLSLTLPTSVTSIAANAFTNCSSLSTIYYPGTKEQFAKIQVGAGNDPFANACVIYFDPSRSFIDSGKCGDKAGWVLYDNYELVIDGTGATLYYASSSALPWSKYLSLITTININEGITTIGEKLFCKASSLKYIRIPSTIYYIANAAFLDCTSLTAVLYNGESWIDIDKKANNDVLNSVVVMSYDTSRNITLAGSCGTTTGWILYDGEEIVFKGNGIINNYSSSSALPWSNYRSTITSAIFENGITILGSKILTAHSALTKITIPDTVAKINDNTLYNASALSEVYYEGNPSSWTNVAIGSNNTALDSATIYYGRPDLVFDVESLSLEKGNSYRINATTNPSEMTVSDLIWTSSNKKVATVSEDGTVTAISGGTAVITAKSLTDQKIFAECEVSVSVLLEDLIISSTELSLEVGQNEKLSVTFSPEDATDINLIWTSSDDSVATVEQDGTVTANSEGTANIYVTAEGYDLKKTCTVIVTDPTPDYIPVTNIFLDITDHSMEKGETVALTATIEPENATNKNVLWASSSEEVATVDENGLVAAISGGSAIITATTEDGEFVAECLISVFVPVTNIVLTPTEVTILTDETAQLDAHVYPEDATEPTVLWLSSNEEVATVDENGLVTAISVGTAVITAETCDGSFGAECKVTVQGRMPDIIPVEGVLLDKTEISLKKGETTTLTATVEPEDATSKEVNWFSSDENIATVDENGIVTAVSGGTAIITVSTADGVYTAECQVSVCVPVTGIILDCDPTIPVLKNETLNIVATIEPHDATNKKILWTSSNEKVATVDENGTVTTYSAGQAIITATTEDGGFTAQCIVDIVVPAKDIVLNMTELSLTEGNTQKLVATVSPEDTTDTEIMWTTSNADVAIVDDYGVVTAITEGTVIITATVANASELYSECSVTVSAPEPDPVPTGNVHLNLTDVSLQKGETAELVATVEPEDATNKNVYWTSSDETIATVNENGIVTAVSGGTAIITVTTEEGGFTAECLVSVFVPVEGVSLNAENLSLTEGSTAVLIATVYPEDATEKNILWSSSDETVATVDENGIVTAIFKGVATISAETSDGTFVAECIVTVSAVTPDPEPDPIPATGITLDSKEIALFIGDTATLQATITPEDADNRNIFWQSSDETIATVDGNGTVTAVSEGTTVITAKTEDGGFTAECTVTVSAKEPKSAEIIVSSVQSREGKTVDVTVSISGNTGFTNMAVEIGYNSDVLTLVGVAENTETGATFTPAETLDTKPFNMSWNSVKNNTFNGTLVTLTFEVSEDAEKGSYPITIDYYKGVNSDYSDGEDVNFDEEFNPIIFEYKDGEITVTRHKAGDINDDGKVNEKDSTLLLRYLAGWTMTDINEYALDTNGDGFVDSKDALNFLRYLAGWNVQIY